MDGSKFFEGGVGRAIGIEDFMIVAPFNRQRKELEKLFRMIWE